MSEPAASPQLESLWDQPTAYERWYASSLGRCYGASMEAVLHPWLSTAQGSRVLAPAGRAVLAVLNRRSLWEITRRLRRPLSRTSYYDGRFFSEQELRDRCTAAGLDVADCRSAVHFPPIPPGPLARLYLGWDRWACKRRHRFGGVLLCHATKRAKTSARNENR